MRISPKIIGNLAYYLGKSFLLTQRVKMVFHPDFDEKGPGIFGFWHDKQLAPLLLFAKYTQQKRVGLVSPSYDGEIIATWLTRLGYKVIRGSSNKQPRSSLVKLIQAAKEGFCIGIAADGPRGPRFEVKSGMAFVAKKSHLPIVPVGVAYSKKWISQKSWDKFQLPLPFGKIACYIGAPFRIEEEEETEVVNQRITAAINKAEERAAEILISPRA